MKTKVPLEPAITEGSEELPFLFMTYMEKLSTCFQENSLPVVGPWIIGAAFTTILVSIFLLASVWILARNHKSLLWDHYNTLDRFLSGVLPQPWHFLKSRFNPNQMLGLELTAGATFILLLTAVFAEILEGWVDEEFLYQVDQAAHCALQDVLSGPSLDAFIFITHLADAWVLGASGLILFGVLLYRRMRWQALTLVLALGLGQALLWGMKSFFSRPRPGQQLLDALGQSFPSGHSFSATVFYAFLVFLLWYSCKGAAVRLAGTLFLFSVILAVAVSRLVLSVHWVSDVLGGIVIGLAWLLTSLLLARGWALYRRW